MKKYFLDVKKDGMERMWNLMYGCWGGNKGVIKKIDRKLRSLRGKDLKFVLNYYGKGGNFVSGIGDKNVRGRINRFIKEGK